jgi:gas vesicle structural protein
MAMQTAVSRAPRPSGLADVLELILDKGLVIDAYVRVSLVGIELLTIDARIVVASVDTYLRFAEAVNRLDLVAQSDEMQLTDMFGDSDKNGESGRSQTTERSLDAGDGASDEEQDEDADTVSADDGDGDRGRNRDDSARSEAADDDDAEEAADGDDAEEAADRDDEEDGRNGSGEDGARDRDDAEGENDDQTGLFGKIRERGKVYE